MGLLDIGAGAGEGLETLLARQLAEERFAEQKRATQATEGYRDRALNETSALRRQTATDTRAERGRQDEDRNANRIARTVSLRPIGTSVTPQERTTEVASGVPEALYRDVLPQVQSRQMGTVSRETTAAPGRIEFQGTAGEQANADRIAESERRAREAEADRDRSLAQGDRRENRLQSWGAPVITINNPGSPTGATVVGRDQLPRGGAPAPPTQTQRTDIGNNEVSAVELERLNNMFDQGAGKMVGPAEGRLRVIGQNVPGLPTNEQFNEFSAASAAFRNKVIKAITGAQMSEVEATRIRTQIPEVTDKPEVWKSKYRQSMANLRDLQAILARQSGGSGTGMDTGPMKDLYQQYQQRHGGAPSAPR